LADEEASVRMHLYSTHNVLSACKL